MQITKNDKLTFLSAIICGFISYGYLLTHNFLTYDSMWNLCSDQNMISSGRQFLMYACKISSDYNLPWLNGLLAIFYLAVNSCFLVRLLEVKEKVTAILIAGFTVMFPSVTSTFAYSYTVDGYMLAVLLATIAVYLTGKYKYGFFAGIILLGFSIGIYQAYYSYAIVLCIVVLFEQLLKKLRMKEYCCLVGKFVVMGVMAYIFYVLSLKLMLAVQHTELSGYQGTSAVATFQIASLATGLKTAFWSFVDFARWANVLTTNVPMKIAFVMIFVICGGEFLYLFVSRGLYKDWYNYIWVGVLTIAIPFGATMVAIISPDTYIHLLVRMPWALLFVFATSLGEWIVPSGKIKRIVPGVSYFFCFVMLFEFAVVANIVGYNMNERYEKTYATCVRIVDRLEQTEGYETGMPVAILGGFPNTDNYPHTDITAQDLSGYFGVSGELCVNSTAKYAEFMSHYLNVTITCVSEEAEQRLVSTNEFEAMNNYPSEDSIRIIDGVWVIRING